MQGRLELVFGRQGLGFGMFALGDVLDRADHAPGFAVGIPFEGAVAEQPAAHPVDRACAKFQARHGLPGQAGGGPVMHSRPVVGMQQVDKPLEAQRIAWPRWQPIKSEGFLAPGDLTGREVDHPATDMLDGLRIGEQSLLFAQRVLGSVTFRDVAGNPELRDSPAFNQ